MAASEHLLCRPNSSKTAWPLATILLLLTACEEDPTPVDRWRANEAERRPSGSAPSMVFVSGTPVVSAPAPRSSVLKVHDLEAAEARFRGWSVKAPDDIEVQSDLDGARIRSIGSLQFDLGIKLGPSDLTRFREGLLAGAKATKSDITLTEDTKTSLTWTTQHGSLTLYGFRKHLTKSGESFLCYTVTERESQADFDQHREACATITKK